MTGLTDTLRERLSRRGRTARADCGALGVLTVEALPPGDCAALLRGSGGKRALLYAACRELQRAGEDLRREGRVFTPDEIMGYVSGGELSAAVKAVLAISGAEDPDTEETEEAEETEETEEADGWDGPEAPASPAPPPEAGGAPPAPPVSGGSPEGSAPVRRSGFGEEDWTETGGAFDDGDGENRLETVQDFGEGFPEIRQGFVRSGEAESGPEAAPALSQSPEVRPGPVRERAGGTGPEAEGARAAGQASRETSPAPAAPRRESGADKKPQGIVSGAENRTQNVAEATDMPAASRRKAERPEGGPLEAAHETGSEFPEGPHESKSEIPAEDGEAAHEFKSEFPEEPHETKSEIPAEGGEAAHETESEFPEEPHEVRSEIPAEGGEAAHEFKSEFPEGPHETKSDFRETARETGPEPAGAAVMTEAMAERAAEFLLEGLRRAAGAR